MEATYGETHLERVTKGGKVEVHVKDKRDYPNYNNVHITALMRNVLNANGLNWEACVAIVDEISDAIETADYLMDDAGRTFALSFVPFAEDKK